MYRSKITGRWILVGLLCCLSVLALSCAQTTPVAPTRVRPTVGPRLTRVPAPIPRPTRSPLDAIRSVSPPDAPEVLSSASAITNVVCLGPCVIGGAASWVTSDVQVGWTHADPLAVDYYEVWQSTNEPYFDPDSCTNCQMATTTTGLQAMIADSPGGWNPVFGTTGATLMSDLDFYLVRAVNAGGVSEASNIIGVTHYSLLQDIGSLVE